MIIICTDHFLTNIDLELGVCERLQGIEGHEDREQEPELAGEALQDRLGRQDLSAGVRLVSGPGSHNRAAARKPIAGYRHANRRSRVHAHVRGLHGWQLRNRQVAR